MRSVWLMGIFALGCKANPEEDAVLEVKEVVTTDLDRLFEASSDLQAAAPNEAWTSSEAMKAPWKDARIAYERIEGAIATLFPNLDASTDERYDGFIAEAPDDYLFDNQGVTGVHGLERIIWAEEHPAHVIAFESALPNYVPAAFPSTTDEASDLKQLLAQQLIDDVEEMSSSFEPLALDPTAAYDGVINSMAEQLEKVNLASTGEDESRYAQHTLADMRANLEGGKTIYAAFSPWLAKEGGQDIDSAILEGFDRVSTAYDAIDGDAIPEVPEGWNPDAPSEAHLATEYGKLWTMLNEESDPTHDGSLVERMKAAADQLAIPISL